jgi:hypothetical protein
MQNSDNRRVYTFSFVDTSDTTDPVIHKYEFGEMIEYPEVLTGFLRFLSEVHGYDVGVELGLT